MQLFCRQCGAEIPAENINLDHMMAKCANCNAVFSFADMYADVDAKAKRDLPVEQADVPMPPGIEIHAEPHQVVIKRRWFTPAAIFMLVFAGFWLLISLFVFGGFSFASSVPLNRGVSGFNPGVNVFSLFSLLPLFFVGIGLFIAYMALASLVNTTTITANSDGIRIQHGPLPYPGKRLDPYSVQQLYTREVVRHNRNSNGRYSTSVSYSLSAVAQDGRMHTLLNSLPAPEHAQFIEQQLERFLNIQNQPVGGEYRY